MSTQVFPALAGLGWSVTRDQIFMTRQQESISGKRTFIADQSYPRHKWGLTFNFLRQGTFNAANWSEFTTLYGFIMARQGRFDSFLYQDTVDNVVAGQEIGVGDGSTVQFQLIRSLGGFAEPILAPNIVTSLTVAGVTKVQGTDYGVGNWENGATPNGTINFFTGAPAAGAAIVASFSYYWPCTFSSDTASFENFMQSLWAMKKLEFETVK